MPKLNFNVPLLNTSGEPQLRQKVDRKKLTPQPNGSLKPEPVLDDDGYVVQEEVLFGEVLANLVDNLYQGEDTMTHSDRLARGKLARKLADKTEGSLKNYSREELAIIETVLVKSQTPPNTVAQFDDIVEGAGNEKAAA